MKKTITLTKMLVLALMLVTVTTASASYGGDEKCKTKCCKEKKNREIRAAVAELEKAIKELEAELKSVSAELVTSEVKQSLQQLRTIRIRPAQVFAFAAIEETNSVDARYKINFSDLNREMDKEQEKMSTSPADSQKIDFSNLVKEMEDVQEKMSSPKGIRS